MQALREEIFLDYHNPFKMINVDTRFLESVEESEMWLVLHLLKMVNPKTMSCFPSNKTLCDSTRWDVKKLQRVKERLFEKGILKIEGRTKRGKQTSNNYIIDSELLGVFVPAKLMEFQHAPKEDMLNASEGTPKGDTTSPPKMGQRSINQKEVLDNTGEPSGSLEVDLSTTISKENRVAVAKAIHVACAHFWLKEFHPDWSWKKNGAAEGKALKNIIDQLIDKCFTHRDSGKGKTPTGADIIDLFMSMCKKLPEFYKHQTLTVISPKVDPIIDQIKEAATKMPSTNVNSASATFGNYAQ